MPTYEYACRSCGRHIDVQQSFTDDALTTCPTCGGQLRKVFGNIAISFKGTGFYSTDNRSLGKSGTPSKGDGEAAASTDGGDGGGGKGDAKSPSEAGSSSSGESSSSTSEGSAKSSDSGSGSKSKSDSGSGSGSGTKATPKSGDKSPAAAS
jgi:putative FmdB family regulatory protein